MNVPVLALMWFAFRNLEALPNQATELEPAGPTATLRDTLTSRSVWTLAIFLMLYVG